MDRMRTVARLAAVILAALFVAVITVGAYFDVGGWPGVAAVWGGAAVSLCMARVFVWAVDNWNAPR